MADNDLLDAIAEMEQAARQTWDRQLALPTNRGVE